MIVDLPVGLLMQVSFALVGLGLGLLLMVLDHAGNLMPLGIGLAFFSGLILVFAALQRRGLITSSVKLLGRFVKGPMWHQLVDDAGKLEQQVQSTYGEKAGCPFMPAGAF